MAPVIKGVILIVGIAVTIFVGTRFTLARQRWRECRYGLTRQQSAKSMESAFLAVLRQREAALARNLQDHLRLFNASLFVLMWNWDLLFALDQLRTEVAPQF